jgi:glycerol-3-phosphate dehydrogenase (NAD(P)+)
VKVAVVGAGSWGTAFAGVVATNAPTVLWARNHELATTIERRRENVDYLEGITLPDNLHATSRPATASRPTHPSSASRKAWSRGRSRA